MAELKLSACIEMIFSNVPEFTDRIAKVKECGLPAFEFWGWKNKDLAAVKAAADASGMTLAGFCCESTGALVDASNTDAWVEGAKESIDTAVGVGVKTLIVTTGNEIAGACRCGQHEAIVAGLKGIAPYAEANDITLVLEPLNLLVDHAGYYLSTSKEGFEILDKVGSPKVKLLYDIYHQQITEGNLIPTITNNIDKIGHFHVADHPGRFEPTTGEINYANVFKAIAGTNYAGHIGLEFRCTGCPCDALAIVKELAGV